MTTDQTAFSYDHITQSVKNALANDPTLAEPASPKTGVWGNLKKASDIANYKPQARPEVVTEKVESAQGEFYVLKDRVSGVYLRLASEDYFLWNLMDGSRTVIDLVVAYCMQYKALAQARVIALVEGLRAQSLLVETPYNAYGMIARRLARRRPKYYTDTVLRTLLMHQIAIKGIDRAVGWLYDHFVKIFYAPPLLILMTVVALLGGLAYGTVALSGRYTLLGDNDSVAGGLVTLFLLQVIGILLHEGGHAFTVKHFKREVWRAGLLIYFGLIGAFVDTTDMWLENRWKRIAVTAAGPYVNLVLGGIGGLLLLVLPEGYLAGLVYQFALGQYLLVSFNLTPFIKLDGYYILTDFLGVEALRDRALAFMRGALPQRLIEAWNQGRWLPTFTREEKWMVAYGAISLLWTVNLFLVAVLLAPLQFVRLVNNILSGADIGQILFPLFVITVLMFGFFPRIFSVLYTGFKRLVRFAQRQPAWQVAAILAGLAALVCVLPLYITNDAPAVAALYARIFPMAASVGALLFARGQARYYRASRWQPLFIGIALTSALFALTDLLELIGFVSTFDLVTLDALARLHAVSLVFTVIGWLASMRLWTLSLWSDLRWTWLLLFIGCSAVMIAAFTEPPLIAPLLGDQFGQYLWVGGLFLHQHLTRRGLPKAKAVTLSQAVLAGDATQQGKFALKWLAERIVQQVIGAVGQEKLLPLAREFNRSSAANMRRVWITMEGEVGSNPQGEWTAIQANWRAALHDLLTRCADLGGQELTRSALFDAFADLPRPVQVAGYDLLADTPWSAGLDKLLDADSDHLYLERAFHGLGESLLTFCARVYGWRIGEQVIAEFNRKSALNHWEVWVRAQGKFDYRPTESALDLPTKALRCRSALNGLIRILEPFVGREAIHDLLTRGHDALPWTQREVASSLLLADAAASANSEDQRILLLRSLDLLASADRETLATLARRMNRLTVRAGQEIAKSGQLYIIAQGRAQTIRRDSNGVLHVESNLTEGEPFGLNVPPDSALVATTDLTLWTLDAHSLAPFTAMMNGTHPEISAKPLVDWRLLQRSSLFRELAPHQIEAIVAAMQMIAVEAGHPLITQGQAADGLYVVQSGQCEVFIPNETGERRIAALGPGEIFGEQSLVTGSTASATVRAAVSSQVLRLSAEDFQRLFQPEQAVMRHLEQTGSRRRLTTREPLTLAT